MRRKDTRPLTVYGTIWEYKIGRNTVAIYDPEGNRYFPKFTEIVGEWEVDKKRFQLNPATLLNYIQTKILGNESELNRCQHCKLIKADVRLRVNPFDAEIYGNYAKHFYCEECEGAIADEI